MEKIHFHVETLKSQGQIMTINLTTDIPGLEKISTAALMPKDSVLGKEIAIIVSEMKRLKREELKDEGKKTIAAIKKKRKLTASKKK